MSEAYRKGSHTIYDIQYHFVWVTKYRFQVLKGDVGLRAREVIRQICEARNITILSGHISKEHVHIHVSCPPELSPSKIVQYIKGRSSRIIQQEFSHIRKRYWGQHFWARGYFCATVGQMTEEMIKEYLEHHFEPKPNDDFKMEPD